MIAELIFQIMDFQGWCGLQNEEKHAHIIQRIHENITILLVLTQEKNGL